MLPNTEERPDLLATIVSLAAQATLLQARIQTLREELAAVNARTRAISRSLHHMDAATARPSAESVPEAVDGRGRRRRKPAEGSLRTHNRVAKGRR
ncbi:hypothetical protein ABZ614_11495 [Streptomyces sp. NPDC013178]|uniref:hypothetical protein n=1 Tax=Streptomyces sp. NPDC013178 TaxID=3155118 RepID=UPI0033CE8D13